MRVLKIGAKVQSAKVGDLCLVFSGAWQWNRFGFVTAALAYDSPGSIGLMAKTTKLHERQIIALPEDTPFHPAQWAGFSLRYVTAFGNWKVAHGTFRLMLTEQEYPHPYVVSWGGGVAWAQLELAKLSGYQCIMFTSDENRMAALKEKGIAAIDRRPLAAIHFSQQRYQTDVVYKKNYTAAEQLFLQTVAQATNGEMASILIDHIGEPVFRASLKALAQPSVITTSGWKLGMHLSTMRAFESGYWHQHINTSYARYPEAIEAIQFAQTHNWIPPFPERIYQFDEIPQLAQDYADGKTSYFPIFQVNPL
ncbi:MAG: zinc-binding alcohol dehydrogenase family protein [Ignavibacteriae bacterium]|nr:zinc-binding alcohol dehydrogenase family protein [Ignavibacteriota bacterium]